MRDTFKTITFPDFVFKYARAGIYDEANAVTVCEPGFEHRKLHNKMSAIIVEAETQAWKKYVELTRDQKTETNAAAPATSAEIETPTVNEDGTDKEAAGPDMIAICRTGMPAEAYVSFLDYILAQLKDNKHLAFVGSDASTPIKERIPLTDEVWMNIAREGGNVAVNKILGGFAGFFSELAAPRQRSGTARSS